MKSKALLASLCGASSAGVAPWLIDALPLPWKFIISGAATLVCAVVGTKARIERKRQEAPTPPPIPAEPPTKRKG
jgi:hypothetical protein